MYPHHIRLAAPWEPVTVDGTSRLRRRFGRPRQLDDWERLWLIPNVAPNERIGTWRLNGGELEWVRRGDGPWRAEVTKLLRERNELIADAPEFAGERPFGGAILEIGCRAFIQRVRV